MFEEGTRLKREQNCSNNVLKTKCRKPHIFVEGWDLGIGSLGSCVALAHYH